MELVNTIEQSLCPFWNEGNLGPSLRNKNKLIGVFNKFKLKLKHHMDEFGVIFLGWSGIVFIDEFRTGAGDLASQKKPFERIRTIWPAAHSIKNSNDIHRDNVFHWANFFMEFYMWEPGELILGSRISAGLNQSNPSYSISRNPSNFVAAIFNFIKSKFGQVTFFLSTLQTFLVGISFHKSIVKFNL